MLHLNDEYVVNAADGVYSIVVNSMDYRADNSLDPKDFATVADLHSAMNAQFTDYTSTETVRVKAGKVNLGDIYNAATDLLEQTGYWGKFVDEVTFVNGKLKIHFGS